MYMACSQGKGELAREEISALGLTGGEEEDRY